ncbi:MAG: dihydroneopterin aldolase [Candidatus Kapaibacterium sp.]
MSKIVSPVRLSISNAQFFAYHGVKQEEKNLGGQYQIDVDLVYDSTQAVLSDDVNVALNYEEAMFCLSEVMNDEDSYNLVETVVYEILNAIFEKFPQVFEATCRVRKMNVPIRQVVDYIEVEQTMQRD